MDRYAIMSLFILVILSIWHAVIGALIFAHNVGLAHHGEIVVRRIGLFRLLFLLGFVFDHSRLSLLLALLRTAEISTIAEGKGSTLSTIDLSTKAESVETTDLQNESSLRAGEHDELIEGENVVCLSFENLFWT